MGQFQDPEFIKQFHVLGTSHRRAPVEVRERLTVSASDAGLRALELIEQAGIAEAAIVSTCLRSEFYIFGNGSDPRAAVAAFWSRCFGIEPAHFRPFLYCKSGRTAVSHLFRVVAGLDSLIVGENQARQRASDERHIQLGVFRDVERPTLNEHLDHAQQVSQESGPAKITDLLRQFG